MSSDYDEDYESLDIIEETHLFQTSFSCQNVPVDLYVLSYVK